jgi:hypothetical protein
MKNKIISTLALLSFVGGIAATSQAHASTIREAGATQNSYTAHAGATSSTAEPQALPYWHYIGVGLGVLAVLTEFAGGPAQNTAAHVGAASGDALFDNAGR